MKTVYISLLLIALGVQAYAQVGIGTETPNTRAVLELKSPTNNQGLILPSFTTAQRTSATFTSQLHASENGLLVFDSDENKFYYWQDNAWQVILSGTIMGGATGPAGGDLTGNYPAPTITNNAVTTAKINNNAVTSAKILDGTIATADLADNAVTTVKINNTAVTTAKIADGAITDVKIAAVAPSKLTAGGATSGQVLKYNGTNWIPDNAGGGGTVTSVATTGGLTGGPVTATGTISIADGGVSTLKLADNAVTTLKISNDAVTSAKIADGTIATADLADNAITTVKINNNAVTDAKIAAVAPSKLTAGGATSGQVLKYNGTNWIPDNAGGGGTVTSVATTGGLTGGPVTTTGTISIADDGVTSVKIADGTIVNADINATAAIVDTKLATITTAGKVSGNAITSGTIGGSTAVNTTGNITTTGRITATNATTSSVITSSNTATGGYAVSGSSTSTNGGGGISGAGSGVTVGRVTTYSYGVYGSNSFSGAYGWIGADDGVYGNNTSGTGVAGEGYYGVFGTGSYIGVIGSAPNVTGNYGVYSAGQAGGTTTWAATSDFRFKRNIQPLSHSLDNILKLRGVSYDWRTDEFPEKNFKLTRDIGVIAQEILNVIPEVVVQDKEGYYSVSYEKIVPVLIEAIKELEQQITTLKQETDKIEALKARLDAIEKITQLTDNSLTARNKP